MIFHVGHLLQGKLILLLEPSSAAVERVVSVEKHINLVTNSRHLYIHMYMHVEASLLANKS